ncbi:MAG: hypothetical protein LBR00_01180 [Clostridiales Family XIII bacterium]|jgi:hypothetical protein|nr:hypothetical protein [Clostridiales Family XIII bacterium]
MSRRNSGDEKYARELREKAAAFMRETRTRKAAHTTMITTFGLKRNSESAGILFQLSLDDLFE